MLFQGNREALDGFTDEEATQLVELLYRVIANLDRLTNARDVGDEVVDGVGVLRRFREAPFGGTAQISPQAGTDCSRMRGARAICALSPISSRLPEVEHDAREIRGWIECDRR